jgi:hypothetical protein
MQAVDAWNALTQLADGGTPESLTMVLGRHTLGMNGMVRSLIVQGHGTVYESVARAGSQPEREVLGSLAPSDLRDLARVLCQVDVRGVVPGPSDPRNHYGDLHQRTTIDVVSGDSSSIHADVPTREMEERPELRAIADAFERARRAATNKSRPAPPPPPLVTREPHK